MNIKWIIGLLLVCVSSCAFADDMVSENKPSTSNSTVIAESEMSIATLEQLFKNSFFKTSTVSNGDLSIQIGSGHVQVRMDKDHKLLRFYKVFSFRKPEADPRKIAMANQINSNVVLVRASVLDERPNGLVFDYFLSYDASVPAYQIVWGLRYFSEVVNKAVNEYDTENIVQ